MKKTYKLLKFKARFLAYTVLLGVLLYAVAGRVLLSYLPDYRQQLESYLSDELGVPVELGQLTASWDGFDPILQIRNISINNAHNAHVQSADIKFAFLNTLIARAPRVKSITLDSVNLGLRQDSAGVWWLSGFDLSRLEVPESDGHEYKLEDVLDGANLLLLDAFVRVDSQLEDERVWRLPSASLSYLDSRIYARGNVIEPDGLQPLLRFVYNSDSLVSSKPTTGRLFVEARSAGVFDNILQSYSWQGLSLQNMDASGRVWLDLQGTKIAAVFAELQMHRLNWQLDEKSLPPLVNSSMRVAWRGNEHGQRVDLYDLEMRWKDRHCKVSSALYESNAEQHNLGFSSLDLGCVNDFLLSLGVIEGRLAERLHTTSPRGNLENLNVAFETAESGLADFRLAGELSDVVMQAFDGAPAVSGVNGYIETNLEGGFVRFDAEQMGLAFPELYLKGWQASRAHGQVRWDLQSENIEIIGTDLGIEFASGGSVFGDFLVRLNDDQHEDYLALVLGMSDIPFQDVSLFVPFYVVPENLYEWLNGALMDGKVADGLYTAYGSIESNSADNSFSSSLRVSTRDGVLKFDEAWPELRGLNLDIALHEDRLEITGEKAVIADTNISNLEVLLPGTLDKPNKTQLSVDLSFLADTPQYEFWLGESPLSETLAGLHESIQFEGKTEGKLNLKLDLDDDLKTAYDLELKASDLDARVRNTELEFNEINGVVDISSERGVNADSLNLKAFGYPAQAQITQISDDNPLSSLVPESTQISMAGTVSIEAISALHDATWNYGLSGEADFQAELNLPGDDTLPAELTMRSLLSNIESSWPEPLSKQKGEPVSLRSKVEFKPKQTNIDIELAGSRFPSATGTLLFIDDVMSFGRINVDARKSASESAPDTTTVELPSEGLNFQVDVDELDVEPWVQFVREVIPSEEQGIDSVLGQISVRAGTLRSHGMTATDVTGLIHPDDGLIELSGNNVIGKITLPTQDTRLDLNFDRLHVSTDEAEAEQADSEVEPSVNPDVDPREFVSFAFASKDTVIDGKGWGAWSFYTESDDVGLLFRNIRGQVHEASFRGQLNWQYFDGHYHTILTLTGEGKDIDPVLGLFGQTSPLASEKFSTDLALVWPDQPQNFALERLSGSAAFTFEEGLIKTNNNATGVLRMFGIFNADAIGRRLRLDFSDLYKEGISYDTVRFNAVIDQGAMSLVDPLRINGPSSNYEISGNVDLAQQELDLKMLLQLPLASNVPLAGLMLGAPAVGGAVWLVDKILGEPLSRLSTVRYSISGNWNDPQMKLEKAINAK